MLAAAVLGAIATTLDAGPVLGDLTSSSVRIWLRTATPAKVVLHVTDDSGMSLAVPAETRAQHDNTVTLHVDGLPSDARCTYTIDGTAHEDWWFRTRPEHDTACRIAFGSCANEQEGSASVWNRMNALDISALVLLGDTPYIDTTDLATQRARHRTFATVPAFARLVAHTPLYATWDDHDFGLNDTDGRLEGKENSRRAFDEYRPNPTCGEHGQGIYTSFRQGPVEVFLLDTRWFARTQAEDEPPTLLGASQWAWLERSLRGSTAPFKVLACGMVFNGAVRPGKTDCWGAYPAEYARLIDLLARTETTGAVLVSGDVHWSRAIRHDTPDTLGTDLIEFVTSPIHEHLIKAADAPHPGLVFSAGEVNSFLVIEARQDGDSASLTARLLNARNRELHRHRIDAVTTPSPTVDDTAP